MGKTQENAHISRKTNQAVEIGRRAARKTAQAGDKLYEVQGLAEEVTHKATGIISTEEACKA